MVARLAARLKAQPNDPAGWQRLIRSYSVLGQKDKARAALASARAALKGNKPALSAIMAEAKSLGVGS
jgi:cytochrome c-type biogenesis protein CcmH